MHLCIKKPQHYVPNLQWCADVHQFPHRHRTLQPNVNINCEDIGLRLRRRQLSKQPIIELKPLEGDTASFNPSKQMPDNKDMLSVTLTPSAMLDTNAAELAIKPSNNQLRNLLGPKSNNVSEMHHSQAWKLKHDLFFHRTASKDYYSKTNLLQKPIINIKRQNHQFRNEVFVHNTDTATVQSCAGKTAAKKPDGDKCEADCSRNDAEDEIKSKALVCQAICKGLPVWEVLSSTCGVSQMPPPPNQSACSANTSKSETNNPPKCDARNQPSKPLCAPLKSKCGTQTESSSTEPYDARKKPETPLCQPSEPKCGTTESFADVKPATRMCELPKTQFGGKPECSTTKKGGVSQATVPTQSSTLPPCDTNCDADQTKTENRKKENSASNYPAFHPNSCGAPPPRTKSRIPKQPSHRKCQKSGHIKEPESDLPSIAKFTTNSNKEPDQSGSVDACGNEHGYDIDGIPHPATMSLRTSQKSLLMCKKQRIIFLNRQHAV